MQQEEAEQQDNVEQAEESRCVPLAESLSYGAGTFLAAGVVDLVAHFGPTGLVVGGIVAYVASQHGPEFVEQVRGARGQRPSPSYKQVHAPHTLASESNGGTSKRSILDRALGRFPAPHEDTLLEDADTILVDEPELDVAPQYRPMQQRSARYITHPIRLAPDLVLEGNDIVGAGINLFGVKGSGKTVAMADPSFPTVLLGTGDAPRVDGQSCRAACRSSMTYGHGRHRNRWQA